MLVDRPQKGERAMSDRGPLPQLSGSLLLADGGIETDLIFRQGWDLPSFAAFVLLDDSAGTEALRDYYRPYLSIARSAGFGLVLETPTWRAGHDWGDLLGYDTAGLARVNRQGVQLLSELREEADTGAVPILISGCRGPRADAFNAGIVMTADQALRYHSPQVQTLGSSGTDFVSALTLAYPAEAIGIARSAQEEGVPVVISFTVETDGRLPNGSTLEEAVLQVDEATDGGPAYYMVNCAHFTHLRNTFEANPGAPTAWRSRLRGVRANASDRSHAQLDAATDLDDGDPARFGDQSAQLLSQLPALMVLGGCCGTDARHIEAISRSVLALTDAGVPDSSGPPSKLAARTRTGTGRLQEKQPGQGH